jgi:hypothetical protein
MWGGILAVWIARGLQFRLPLGTRGRWEDRVLAAPAGDSGGTARPHLWRISGARKAVVAVACSGAVLSVQHLFCSIRGNSIWARTPTGSMQVCKRPGRGRSASNQFREAQRGPQSANALRDIFCDQLPEFVVVARACQRGVAGVAAGCWVVGGATAGAAAGRAAAGAAARTRGSQRPFTMRIFRALHLRTAARTAEFRTQMPSTS